MIKIFLNSKTLIKKIIIAIIFVFIFNFAFGCLGNNKVFADELEDGGGKLLLPLHSFLLYVTDSVLGLMQNNFISTYSIIVDASSTKYTSKFKLPLIEYAPEEIFSNNIPLFNINFFNPKGDLTKTENGILKSEYEFIDGKIDEILNFKVEKFTMAKYKEFNTYIEFRDYIIDTDNPDRCLYAEMRDNIYTIYELIFEEQYKTKVASKLKKIQENLNLWEGNVTKVRHDLRVYDNEITEEELNELFEVLNEIFVLDYNVTIDNLVTILNGLSQEELKDIYENFSGELVKYKEEEEGTVVVYKNSAGILQSSVAKIYKSLRIVAIIAMLTILVYVGIRIVLSSAAKDKAKYKQMLTDWLIAFIMLFVLHYLMAFIIDITEKLTDICDGSNVSEVNLEVPEDISIEDNNYKIEEVKSRLIKNGESAIWKTNFIGNVRYYAGLVQEKGYSWKGVAYTIMYMVLVIQVCVFTFQYLKRVLWMAFLTMIAPLVSITYPLDKINDGKAQGFNLWLKEYIFNALLQPIHYIIYVVIMGSAMELVSENPIYGLVALGFMIPAEKFIRKMFGFETASTVGAFSGAAGAALLMGGIQKLSFLGKLGNGSGNNKVKLNNEKDKKPNTKVRGIDNAIPEANSNNNQDTSSANSNNNSDTSQSNSDNNSDTSESDSNNNQDTSSENSNNNSDTSQSNSDNSSDTSETESNNKNKSKNSIKNGFKTLAGHYKRRIKRGIKKLPGGAIRLLRRGATYGLGAATLGTVGLAAGIASGDPTKALQYTAAAGVVGGNIGKNLGDSASNLLGLSGAANAFRAGYYGENYGDEERKKINSEFKNDASNYSSAVGAVGTEGWEEMTQKGGIVDQALDYGINDIGEMCNIYQLTQPPYNKTTSDAFRAYELSKKFGDISSNSKTQENLDKILDSKGYSSANKDKMRKEIVNLIKAYKKISLD